MGIPSSAMRSSIYALVRQNKINSVLFSLIIPTLIGIYATYYTDITRVNALLFWAPVLVFVALAFFTAYITYDVKLAPEVYIEMEELHQQVRELEGSVRFLSVLQEQLWSWNGLVREHLGIGLLDADAFQEVSSEICRILVVKKEALFGIEEDELWNFTLYVFDDSDKLLYPIWRDKHPNHPSSSRTRVWAPGHGHVGIAFTQGESMICADASLPDVRNVFSISNEKEYDRATYVSFASEPIGPVGGETTPYGVLVATSNRIGRFDVASSLALRHAASALATLILLRYNRALLSQVCERTKAGSGN